MITIQEHIENSEIVDSVARGIAFQDAVSKRKVTLDSAVGDLACCLERDPTDQETRLLISRYGRHLVRFTR